MVLYRHFFDADIRRYRDAEIVRLPVVPVDLNAVPFLHGRMIRLVFCRLYDFILRQIRHDGDLIGTIIQHDTHRCRYK